MVATIALLTDALNELASEGHRIDPEAVAALSPSMTQHQVCFGLYHMGSDSLSQTTDLPGVL